jgi:hypothetical protein
VLKISSFTAGMSANAAWVACRRETIGSSSGAVLSPQPSAAPVSDVGFVDVCAMCRWQPGFSSLDSEMLVC